MKVRKIKQGATLGIICPSGRQTDNERVKQYLDYLTILGYKYKIGKSLYASEGYLAGSDELRAKDINEFFSDDEVDAILCYKGGYGAGRMLPLIDFENMKKNPKLLVGFSDVTVLLNSIYQKANIPTLHGEMGIIYKTNFLEEKEFSFNNLEQTLKGISPTNLLEGFDNVEFRNHGKVIAPIVGGNLSLICGMQGTPYEVDVKDKILFIEEVHEAPYAIDRFLCQLKLAGKLNQIKALIFGYFTNCGEDTKSDTQTVMDVINEYTKELTCPIIINFPSGHNRPFVNIPIGINVEIDTDKKSVIVLEDMFFDK